MKQENKINFNINAIYILHSIIFTMLFTMLPTPLASFNYCTSIPTHKSQVSQHIRICLTNEFQHESLTCLTLINHHHARTN